MEGPNPSDGVNVVAADKALALITREIAKRRKALSPALGASSGGCAGSCATLDPC